MNISAEDGAGEPRLTRRHTRSVTLSDVAAHSGVSAQTVSRAIRTPDQVSEHTLERVQRSIQQTGYVPNLAASNLASNRSMTVAALVPALSYSVFSDTIHGLGSVLSQHGYHLFIGSTEYNISLEEKLVRAFLGRRPDGVVLVGTAHTPATHSLLRQSNVPVVETWDWTDEPIDSLVGFSNRESLSTMVDYVHERGYKHPTFAGWLTGADSRAVDRFTGFEEAVRRKFPHEPTRSVDTAERGISIEAGRWALNDARKRYPETDVLVCASDIFATGAIFEALSQGLRVPEDIAITGFGDFDMSEHLQPALTTIRTPNKELGQRAGRLLLDRITGASKEPQSVNLGFTLKQRESA